MARYKLRSPDQPFALQAVLWLFEFCASLKLAVILISSAAVVLGWATFVESAYGLSAVQFGVYGTWWFALLNALLALNIFCAAAIRFPWARYQTGFVITHVGLLTLLFGCLLSRNWGIDAQMPIFEGRTNFKAYEDRQHLALTVRPVSEEAQARPAPLPPIALEAGTFNWDDYDRQSWLPPLRLNRSADSPVGWKLNWAEDRGLFWFPWGLARRDRGTIYDQNGIRIEVLDYYSNCRVLNVPYVELRLSSPRFERQTADGGTRLSPEMWSSVPLSIQPRRDARVRPHDRTSVGGGQFVFWLTDQSAETAAFLDSAPAVPLGRQGQVVLSAGDKTFHIQVDEKLGQGRFTLGDALPGWQAEVTRFESSGMTRLGAGGTIELLGLPEGAEAKNPAVEIIVDSGEGEPGRLVLFANLPEWNVHDTVRGVFGSYWYDEGEKKTEALMRGEGGSRIDVLQGHDGKLYYRYWNRHEVAAIGTLPGDGTRVDAFKMPIGQLQMYVDRHLSSPRPDRHVDPLPFNKDANPRDLDRAVKLRMVVDGHAEEFWLVGGAFDPLERPLGGLQLASVRSPRREVTCALRLGEIDVGLNVRLKNFERTLDPGTSQAAHYGSMIDLEDAASGATLYRDVHISMNAPVDFRDPRRGRNYRLFQEAFRGPFSPGDGSGVFELVYPSERDSQARYMTILTVNYDPGRGFKYMGSLLVVVGIATMFYMRAYFFKRVDKLKQAAPTVAAVAERQTEPVA